MKNLTLLCLASILLILLCALGCEKKEITESPPSKKDFIIQNLGVSFGPLNPETNHAGDFLFVSWLSKVLAEFGAIVYTPEGETKELPNITYILHSEAYIFAIAEGIFTGYNYQEESLDYEIGIQSIDDPDFYVGYDHIDNLQISVGDTVAPGDTLGKPALNHLGFGAFEIMINNNQTGLSYCPFSLFNPDSLEIYMEKVLRLMQEWETFLEDTTIYDEKEYAYPGCRMESMVSY